MAIFDFIVIFIFLASIFIYVFYRYELHEKEYLKSIKNIPKLNIKKFAIVVFIMNLISDDPNETTDTTKK